MESENIDKKDDVKGKIILFIIGVLVGAVISTVAFFVCVKVLGINDSTANDSTQQMQGGTPPEMPSGSQNGQSGQGQPPEMPNNQTSQDQSAATSTNSSSSQGNN